MAEKKIKKEKKVRLKGSGTIFKIVLIVLLLLIALALGFVGYTIYSKKTPLVINQASQTETTKKAATPTIYAYQLDEFLLNMADDGGKRYLKIKLSLGYEAKDKKKMDAELADKKDNVRDAIISVLRSKKSTDLDGQAGLDQLKKDIITRVNDSFQYGKIDEVYINDILIQ